MRCSRCGSGACQTRRSAPAKAIAASGLVVVRRPPRRGSAARRRRLGDRLRRSRRGPARPAAPRRTAARRPPKISGTSWTPSMRRGPGRRLDGGAGAGRSRRAGATIGRRLVGGSTTAVSVLGRVDDARRRPRARRSPRLAGLGLAPRARPARRRRASAAPTDRATSPVTSSRPPAHRASTRTSTPIPPTSGCSRAHSALPHRAAVVLHVGVGEQPRRAARRRTGRRCRRPRRAGSRRRAARGRR